MAKQIDIDPALYFEDIRSVKWSQNEDVIVFTEAGVKPRELRRTSNDWLFQEFPLKIFHIIILTPQKRKRKQ